LKFELKHFYQWNRNLNKNTFMHASEMLLAWMGRAFAQVDLPRRGHRKAVQYSLDPENRSLIDPNSN
jgi:hypothetical protein